MSDDPIMDEAPWLRKIPYILRKRPQGPPIPHSERIRLKHPWENWLYGVVRNVNQKGDGTITVYRDGRRIARAGVSGWNEAERLFRDTIEAAEEATKRYVEELEKEDS